MVFFAKNILHLEYFFQIEFLLPSLHNCLTIHPETQVAEYKFRQVSEVFSSNAQSCFPHGNAITPPVAMLLPEVYATIGSQPFDDAKAELISLSNELSNLVIFGENGKFIGGLLHKLRQ